MQRYIRIVTFFACFLSLTSYAQSRTFSQKQTQIRYQGVGGSEVEAWGPYGLTFDASGNATVFDGANGLLKNLDENGKTSTLAKMDLVSAKQFFSNNKNIQYDLKPMKSSHGKITIDKSTFSVEVPHLLAGLRYLGTSSDGNVFVVATDVQVLDTVVVDEVVFQFNKDGKEIGKARVPLSEQFVNVENATALNPSGKVYSLVTHKDNIELRELKFVSSLAPLAAKPQKYEVSNIKKDDVKACSMTRDDMVERAKEIVYLPIQLSAQNISGVVDGRKCTGRGIPRYINGPGMYSGIPYDWGGFDGAEQFIVQMEQGLAAGDIDTRDVESCSYGLDCSGFVSRVWRQDQKYGTFTLHEISSAISTKDLKPGDVLNRSGSHVILFEKFTNNGIQGWESTQYQGTDRSIYNESYWSRVNGYQARRFNGVCD